MKVRVHFKTNSPDQSLVRYARKLTRKFLNYENHRMVVTWTFSRKLGLAVSECQIFDMCVSKYCASRADNFFLATERTYAKILKQMERWKKQWDWDQVCGGAPESRSIKEDDVSESQYYSMSEKEFEKYLKALGPDATTDQNGTLGKTRSG